MSHSDKHLLGRIHEKDSDALVQYIELNRGPLIGFVERQLGSALRKKVEPDDILQEVMVDAVRSLKEIELGDRQPFSWLCQIAERRIIDTHRRFYATQKRDASREIGLGAASGDSDGPNLIDLLVKSMTTPSQAFSRNARELKLQDALNTLPEVHREAIRLRYVEGLASKEIAQRLNKSDGAIRVMLSRSLKQLQTVLGPDE